MVHLLPLCATVQGRKSSATSSLGKVMFPSLHCLSSNTMLTSFPVFHLMLALILLGRGGGGGRLQK